MQQPVAFPLMLASILLLLAFQAFWLHKVYEEQYELLQKESSRLFAKAVVNVQDSILQNWLSTQLSSRSDSVHLTFMHLEEEGIKPHIVERRDTRIILRDSTGSHFPDNGQKMIKVVADSFDRQAWLPGFLQSVILKVQVEDSTGILSIAGIDSTQVNERIAEVFGDSLERSLARLPFTILGDGERPPDGNYYLATQEAPGILPLVDSYQAFLFRYVPFLLQRIAPQILFALLLSSLTITAFLLIYRNLQQQQRLAEMRSGLISNITHELKTPIATVSVAMEALENFNALNNPERTREYLNISRSELNRLSILVDKVLKMAAFEQQGMEIQPETLDLRLLTEETLSYLKVHFDKAGAQVQLAVEGGDFTLEADRIHLTNVIYNLIDNALKYSTEQPRIELYLQNGQDRIQLSVQDSGLGIPPEYHGRIFDKFFRVPRGDEHDIKGYGLGLSYVAKVMEKHQGTIDVQSRPGAGSRFTITLPRTHGKH
ncbi:MAG: GHKL domain-containing protein [Phaeodactylibacter sp.]|nr:GHKL domain-containing protein [Phaeodactylibacter sp.]MCB9051933.1 GHKL domain-containing protein [Lewinellaceae bacterium]